VRGLFGGNSRISSSPRALTPALSQREREFERWFRTLARTIELSVLRNIQVQVGRLEPTDNVTPAQAGAQENDTNL
jgi:hypothetical protein